jgi:uncharacterized membrane protein YciS (DUF1049 family)
MDGTFRGFWVAIVFGAGFHVGWAVIGLVLKLLASAMGQPAIGG